MRIVINGKPEELPAPTTVAQLLRDHGLGGAACAVEINLKIVPKKQHESHVLQDGDAVEIVTLVGGG
jgi:sulfur carrier protein